MDKETLQQLAAFDIDQHCGCWRIPIDDLNGELALEEERVARWVVAIEEEPVREYIARLKPLISALIEDREALRDAIRYAEGQLAHAGYTKNATYVVNEALAASDARLAKLGGGS